MTAQKGLMTSAAKNPEESSVYEMYYEFEEPVKKLAGHRVLALNRGRKEKILTVKISAPEEDILRYLERQVITRKIRSQRLSSRRLWRTATSVSSHPAIEREIRNDLTEKAEDGAIHVFGKNLEQLLMQPPIAGQVVLAGTRRFVPAASWQSWTPQEKCWQLR